MAYCYEVVWENLINTKRTKKPEKYYSNVALKVGGLYMHLRDLKGTYRVLRELPADDI